MKQYEPVFLKKMFFFIRPSRFNSNLMQSLILKKIKMLNLFQK